MREADDGAIRRTGETYEIVFRRRLAKPIEKVWAALTVRERIADWFTDVVFEPDLRLGAAVTITFDEGQGVEVHHGEVFALEPPRLLGWNWLQKDRQPEVVRWELEPDGEGCLLVLTHGGLTAKGVIDVGGGWHTYLQGLEAACDGQRAPPWTPERERAIVPRYAAQVERL